MGTKHTRTINTNFYGDRAYDVLSSVHGQLSDGLWENARGYDKYWMNFDVVQLDDNRIVFKVNSDMHFKQRDRWIINPFVDMSDTEFLAWYAGKLKTVIQTEAKDKNWKKGWWNRSNVENTSIYLSYELDVTVADIYAVYDALLGRKDRTDTAYGKRVYGEKADSKTIAKRTKLQLEKERVANEYKETVAAIDAAQKEAIEKFTADKTAAYEKYMKALKAVEQKYANA